MALVNLSEAARLVGKNRTTIWRHIKSGKLSSKRDHDGNPQIDTSELIRVYGSIKEDATQAKKDLQRSATSSESEEKTSQNKIDELIAEIKDLRESQTKLQEEIRTLTNRLEYKPMPLTEKTPQNGSKELETKPEEDPEWPREVKSFKDTMLRNEIRARYK